MTTDRMREDTDFLAPFLIDEGILTGEPAYCSTELGKRVLDLYFRFEQNPESISADDLKQVVELPDAETHRRSGGYFNHILGAAVINQALNRALQQKYTSIDLPDPAISYASGLVHDLSTTFCRSELGGNQMRHLLDYFIARRLGLRRIEYQTSMHSAHVEALGIVSADTPFPSHQDYYGLRNVLQGDGPLSYQSILRQFSGFMAGEENLPLILMTTSDLTADGRTSFDVHEFDEAFSLRMADTMRRYCEPYQDQPDQAPLLSQALLRGGLLRVHRYKEMVSSLLLGGDEASYTVTTFFGVGNP